MINISTLLKHYKREDVRQAIVDAAQNKEIGILFGEKGFGKRPDVLVHARDILELAKQGATSFHCSEELWSNPLQINPELKRQEIEELRIGWDLIIDIDCKFLEYSQITADLIVQALKYNDVENISVKFSVTGDTPIILELNNEIKLTSIKEAINLFKKGKHIKVLSLNKDLKLDFFEIYNYLSHKDNIYKLYYRQSGVPLLVTGHHSVFIWDKCKIVQKYVKEIKKGDFLISYNRFTKFNPKLYSIINQFYYNNKIIKKKIKINMALCRLIGYYLSEGHLADVNYMIGFSFDVKEKKYIKDCKLIIKELSKHSSVSEHKPHSTEIQIIFYSKEWYSFFKNNCGKGSKNKHLPSFSWKLPKNYLLELIKGYLRGDAHKKSSKYITVKSVSKQLITELIWLCKMHGISANLYYEKNKPHLLNNKMFGGSFVFILKIPRRDLFIKEFNIKRNKFSRLAADKVYPTQPLLEVYKQVKPSLFNYHRAEQMTLKKRMASSRRLLKVIKWLEKYYTVKFSDKSKEIINHYNLLLNSDISLLPVTKLIPSGKKPVYDVSVRGSERFFGGYYPILLHNSGNHGFHIGVPFEAFPEKVNEYETKTLFPDGPRKIAAYLQQMITPFLKSKVLDLISVENLIKQTGLKYEEIIKNKEIDPFSFISIDTILISSRHLYRMPYSFNEKSGLISIPIKPEKIISFDKEIAKPENVVVDLKFLDKENIIKGSARKLLVQAFDFKIEKEENKIELRQKEFEGSLTAVPEEYFPPCMKNILKGLKDGRKRGLFVLTNFLSCAGWNFDEIEKFILEWNKRNMEPLREGIIKSHINYHKRNKKKVLPPNCFNKQYYVDLGFCQPDNFCPKIKNPANYAILKQKITNLYKSREIEKKANKT